ncbi:hypothetical protein I302_108416 [Kwoniella bestiolae CBS 10118]|uniref:Transcription initiation factor TFIID subunit 12 domain-containing protein n=1 Tax=Kwoniella bestiolae CBS 10118 TaxID=1296100 RepID=A0A1B9FVS4_9TREE|nr:hypothetical protein I302_07209 [Kwoniella bestiolae CBS 10118]OCF22863.1 hypothetical protein I302_07209 [Kwoniella bestiolae CBS 10118]
MSRPPSVPPGPSTPGGTTRPPGPQQSVMTINTIMHNLPNLFEMHAQGKLSTPQLTQLRQLMHTHFRQVIASSMAAGRPNPLLNLPPAIDPTMPFMGRPPLISKDAYSALIATTTQHLSDAMAQRAKGVAAQNQNQASQGSNITTTSTTNTPPTQPQVQSQTHAPPPIQHAPPPIQTTIPPRPPPPQQPVQSTITPNQPLAASSSTPTTIAPSQIPQGAVTSAGMAKSNSNPTSVPSPAPTASSISSATATGGRNAGTPNTNNSANTAIPAGILNYNTMRELMKLSPEQRTAWLRAEPGRMQAFNLSAKYWTSRTNANSNANANANVNNAAAGPSRTPQPSQQSQLPTTIAPKALLTPPIPQTLTAPAPAPAAAQPPAPVPAENPNPTTSQPQPDSEEKKEVPPAETKPGDTSKPEPSFIEEKKAATEDVSTQPSKEDITPTDASKSVAPPPADPALPSATANPQIDQPAGEAGTSSVPAFATALPDPKTFALKPPPPPPEPENVRRKRKCKEFIGELHPGMEMEYGVDEVIGEILDGLIDEGLKGATRLAKHRRSDKVELKDIAYFVDQCWGIENPGFDALGHTHRKTHIPPERERRRGRAVNPRAARMGQGRGRDEE